MWKGLKWRLLVGLPDVSHTPQRYWRPLDANISKGDTEVAFEFDVTGSDCVGMLGASLVGNITGWAFVGSRLGIPNLKQ